MLKLAPYFAGAVAALVAMDFAPPVKSAIDEWAGASANASTVQVMNTVDRSHKGDRLVPSRPSLGALPAINNDVAFPQVTIRDKERAAAKPVPAEQAQKPIVVRGSKVPIGCDPAFSPLAASASLNFAGRCLS
jgi:hypothetical protein